MSDGRIGNSNQFLQISGVVSAPAYSFASDNDSGLYRIGANNIGVGVNGAKVLDVATTGLGITGSLTPTTLLDISAGTAGQIKFPATQNASTDANTLDDYEEGTWTPGVSFGGGTTGITYGNRDADYIKIGKNVFVVSACKMTSKGSSTGNAKVTGLPFTTGGGTEAQYAHQAACSYFNMGAFTGVGAVATINTGSAATLDCSYYASGSSGAITSLTDTNFTNTSQVFFSLSYLATT